MAKKISKILLSLSLTLFLAVTLCGSTLAFAPIDSTDGSYIITYSKPEITGLDELVQIALPEKTGFSIKNEVDTNLFATQITQIREYTDGAIETDFVRTAIVLDKERAQRLLTNNNSLTQNYVANFSGTCTLYYTENVDSHGISSYQVNKVVTKIIRTGTDSNMVTSAEHGYVLSETASKRSAIRYNNTPSTGGQSCTLNSSHTGYNVSSPDILGVLFYGVCGYANVEFAEGALNLVVAPAGI